MTETSQTREAVDRTFGKDRWTLDDLKATLEMCEEGRGHHPNMVSTACDTFRDLLAALSEAEERIKTLNADLMSRGDALVELGKSAVQIAAERDTALARIAGMEAGEPVAWFKARSNEFYLGSDEPPEERDPWQPLYTTPSAALVRAVNEAIERAEQACRYVAKHQNWEDDGEGNRYREGFEVACEVCEGAIRNHVERHLAAALSPAPTDLPNAAFEALMRAEGKEWEGLGKALASPAPTVKGA